ncbi:hypothetical protein [Treponema vincentii]|nr:hypothetical protein [Treponema vincentii]
MKLIQKAFLYKLEAEIRNGKLIYTQKRLLSKISKECNLYDFGDEIYESVYKDWNIGIIAAMLFLLAGFIIITIYVNSNTIDNFLFYSCGGFNTPTLASGYVDFIPAVILSILFFVTMRKTVYINSRAGIFEFLYTEEAIYFLSGLIREYDTLYKKYNIKEFTGKYLSEQLEEIKNAVDLKSMSKKEITEIINTHAEQLLDCFCPLCNKRKGINALTINTAISILILTFRHTNIEIGCKECLKEKVKKANIMSLCCGIWNLPFGIPVTLFAIFKNIHSLKYLNMDIPTKALKKYVLKTVK